jgi:hypothetical protein
MSYYPPSEPGSTAPYPPPRPGRGGDGGWSPGVFSPAIFLVALLVIVLLVSAALVSRRGEPAPTATSAASQPTVAAAGASNATATAPPAAAPVFVVANTGGDGVYLRRTPNLDDRDTAYPDGTRLTAIGADVTAGGQVWHHVRTPDGKAGWVPAKYTNSVP